MSTAVAAGRIGRVLPGSPTRTSAYTTPKPPGRRRPRALSPTPQGTVAMEPRRPPARRGREQGAGQAPPPAHGRPAGLPGQPAATRASHHRGPEGVDDQIRVPGSNSSWARRQSAAPCCGSGPGGPPPPFVVGDPTARERSSSSPRAALSPHHLSSLCRRASLLSHQLSPPRGALAEFPVREHTCSAVSGRSPAGSRPRRSARPDGRVEQCRIPVAYTARPNMSLPPPGCGDHRRAGRGRPVCPVSTARSPQCASAFSRLASSGVDRGHARATVDPPSKETFSTEGNPQHAPMRTLTLPWPPGTSPCPSPDSLPRVRLRRPRVGGAWSALAPTCSAKVTSRSQISNGEYKTGRRHVGHGPRVRQERRGVLKAGCGHRPATASTPHRVTRTAHPWYQDR